MDDLRALIDEQLDLARPDRYSAREKDWMGPVIADIAGLIPERQAQVVAAEKLVQARETVATRGVNKLLRYIGESGQYPLDWMDLARRPLSWLEYRTCLEACRPSDFRDWAEEEVRRANRDHDKRLAAARGALWLADQIQAGSGPDGTLRDVAP